MKKILIVLAAAMLITSVSGCGCFRRMRDFLCRGAYCGSSQATVAAPAPMYAAPPTYAAPMAYDPACGYDPSCGYGGVQYGYNAVPMDMGGCDDCQSGYSLPTYGGEMMSPGSGGVFPGPAPMVE